MKKLLLIISLIACSSAFSAEMVPLSKYIKENPKFKEDLPSAAFFVSRCSAVFSKAENRLKQDNRKKYQDISENFKIWGTIYDGSAAIITQEIGMSLESYKSRYKTHLDIYEKQTIENWNTDGDMFVGWVGDDLDICKANYKYFETYALKNVGKLSK
jgi:hypothetical protein